MDAMKKNLEFYIEHQGELVSQFNGRVLLIHDQKIVGDYESKSEAYFYARDRFGPNTFSIIECSPGEEGYSVNYRTVNRFSRMVEA